MQQNSCSRNPPQTTADGGDLSFCFFLPRLALILVAHQEEYRALQALEESESQFRSSKEGGYTSQGWTHIPLVNAREPSDVYQSQRAHFPKTIKVPIRLMT